MESAFYYIKVKVIFLEDGVVKEFYYEKIQLYSHYHYNCSCISRFVLDGHLVLIAQLVARFIFRLATYLCLAGSDAASSPFSVVSLNIFYFWVFFHYRTVLGYKDQM